MQFFQKPIIKFVAIPFTLLGLWLLCSFLLNSYESVTSITYPNIQLENNNNKIMVKDVSIRGTFTAKENNLGTILLKFPDVSSVDFDHQDVLLFRIKEQGQKNWYSQNLYNSGIFENIQPFPFGFPSIENSKEKKYIFELKSLRGDFGNKITVANTFNVRYVFSRTQLLKNPKVLIPFIVKKLLASIFDIDFILDSFIYLTPLLIYTLWLVLIRKQNIKLFESLLRTISKSKFGEHILSNFIAETRWMLLITFIIVLMYSLLTTRTYIGISIFIIVLWITLIIMRIVKSKTSFVFFIVLIGLGFLGIIFSQINFSNRVSSWAYIFLAIGAIQAVFEEKAKI